MTSSRSSISRSSAWLVLVCALFMWVGRADAGRRRVVVLEFDGPKAEKFHKDVVKLLKKSHTVISVDKWNGVAEELDAGKVTEKNVKKIAKKLKVDGVITGKVDKRRDEYIITLRLRAGTSGEILGSSVRTKADGPRLDSQAKRDINDELVSVIDELERNRSGGSREDEDEEDSPKKKKGDKDEDDEDEDKPRKSGFSRKSDDDEDKKKKKKKADDAEKAALSTKRSDDEDEDEDDKRAKKSSDDDDDGERKRKRKRKASADDEDEDEDEEGIEDEVEVEDADHELNVSPSRRAVDATVGLSFTARRLKFDYASDLANVPPSYTLTPVTGAVVDVTVYPMSFGHKQKGIITGLGLNVVYDQVLKINSKKDYLDGQSELQTANLSTKQSRWNVGAVFRYPLGTTAKAPVVGGSLSYGKQQFTVDQMLPNGDPTDIPNVTYTMFTPAAFFRYPLLPKITVNLDAAFHAITNTGDIQTPAQYGAATVSGFDFEGGVDYMITPSIFARAAFRYQTIGFTFKGDPMAQSNTRDSDPEQDVTGARDTYFGGTATIGYVY